MIKKLDNKSIQNICANQVILDLSMCVKELLENSLDAASTVIEIYLKDFGQESIIVRDNGHGIHQDNFTTIIQKGATSKLSTFDDLNIIKSYGFRGEALNALNQISDLTLITRTKDDNYGYKLKFNKENELILKEEIAADYGTSVILEKIYNNFPVRLLDLKNNLKTHYTKITSLVMEYALVSQKTKIILYNETKEKPKEMVLNNGNCDDNLSTRILKVLGKKILDTLIEFQCNLTETFTVQGYVTKNINSGSGKENIWLKKNTLYFYVNRRPINPPKKFQTVLSDIYKQYNPNSKFIAILNFELKNEDVDYNLSPDKREVYLQDEKKLVETFKSEIYSFHENLHSFQKSLDEIPKSQQQNKFQKKNSINNSSFLNTTELSPLEKKIKIDENSSSFKKNILKNDSILEKQLQSNLRINFFGHKEENNSLSKSRSSFEESNETDSKKKYSIKYFEPSSIKSNENDFQNKNYEKININNQHDDDEDITKFDNKNKYAIKYFEPQTNNDNQKKYSIKYFEPQQKISKLIKEQKNEIIPKSIELQENLDDYTKKKSLNYTMKIFEPNKQEENLVDIPQCTMENNEINKKTEKIMRIVVEEKQLSNEEIQEKSMRYSMKSFEPKKTHHSDSYDNKSYFSISNEKIPDLIPNEMENDLIINDQNKNPFQKENFKNLKIIGQFNMGFIISYFKGTNQIFIIDQHAADEKFNYEKLIKEYRFQSQMLINPINLSDLSDIDIHTINENLSIFEQNGFSLMCKSQANELSTSNQLFLKALPCFKNVQFNLDDFYELLKNVNNSENSSNELVRPGKFKSSIAYKACRGSVMVGDCLDEKEMKNLVSKLSDLKSPWNCPHGRPTMIKSENLSQILTKIKVRRPEIQIKFPE